MWAEVLLENWHMLQDSNEIEIRAILLDLRKALGEAELTDLESRAIRAVYMDDPTPPIRTGGSHRPAGGSNRTSAAVKVGISRATLWRTLNSAILKIDSALQYEGNNGKVPA